MTVLLIDDDLRAIISIHTSAREVTNAHHFVSVDNKDFNPHFREGSDNVFGWSCGRLQNFNPHFREGSDGFLSSLTASAIRDFNPHFREGSDH